MPPTAFTNGPSVPPLFPTVTAAVLHHIRQHAAHLAAIDHTSSQPRHLSYQQLGQHAARLASRLRAAGVRPGDRVPLVVKRGLDMLVGIVAVLGCGAQYVPLDGGVVPRETLRRVVEQSGGRVVVCLSSTKKRLVELDLGDGCEAVVVDAENTDGVTEGELDENLSRPESGCYVIYTSGTTGTPKGVDVTHSNVTNLLCMHPGNVGIHPGVKVAQVLNISFDMAAWEILGCLCNGGTLVLRGSDWEKTISEVNVLICTPSILSRYQPRQFPSLRTVATAGEPISQGLADLWASYLTYYNCCGPTETTIVNTMQRHVPGEPLSIGRPTPNNRVYILDDDLREVPIGEKGTMWAGGKGISRGYVGLPELTAQRYLPDTFADDGTKMYNTGDVGLWYPNGSIKILGRSDDQVKIKGFRVELDGVAAAMCAAPEVTKAAALLVEGKLHGFLQSGNCHVPAVREKVQAIMPYYAQPAHYHVFETFPLTPNGKIDKKKLRQMVEDGSDTASATAGSEHSSSNSATTIAELPAIPEKLGKPHAWASSSTIDSFSPDMEKGLQQSVPQKKLPQPLRGLVYRIFIPYRFIFSFVWLANIAAVLAIFLTGSTREWLGNMVAINLTIAVLVRQDFIINALYTIFCSVPTSFPLWLRARCAKIYHLGGVHSSAASCSALWLLAANITDAVCLSTSVCANYPHHSTAYSVLSWLLTAMFLTMLVLAYPSFRKANHNFFERWHRFAGWTMLALFWAQTVIGAHDTAVSAGTALGSVVLRTPAFWLLLAATGSIGLSWAFLRRVRVSTETLSGHAVRLHFDYRAAPVNGSFVRLATSPLSEWHSFATIPASAGGRGFSLVVSNAGDWTRECISNPPETLWVRGVPTCGVIRVATLFRRVLVVATGSGIGPCLGHIQKGDGETQVLWSTRDPERSFGAGMVRSIKERVPRAVIWDTDKLGRPDMVRLSWNMANEFKAEAVIVIANEKITKKIVYGLETRGVRAFGAIWDS